METKNRIELLTLVTLNILNMAESPLFYQVNRYGIYLIII
jgi:hypothetical protein